ncbi:MAG: phosphoadenylyl-sulfate reductase [Methylococcaceae bacterium]|nr:phosphoadenylyl-sulfate reductase [Methylococcaceae bacterium]
MELPELAAMLALELAGKNPRVILKTAIGQFDNIALSFSGAEDVVLVDMALKIRKDLEIFVLDTGRLHPETHRFLEKVRNHYGIRLAVQYPDHADLEAFVREKGLFSFYTEGHEPCCKIRKVDPLMRKLATLDAWITGQRRDQSSATRQNLPEVQIDTTFSTRDHTIIKFNPLANWTSEQVWDYIHAYQVPFNELHSRGYRSIGCEPCTRSILPHQPEREGRWWWEDANKKECGLHRDNLKD